VEEKVPGTVGSGEWAVGSDKPLAGSILPCWPLATDH